MTDRLRRLDALFAERVLGCKVRWRELSDGEPECDCAVAAHDVKDERGDAIGRLLPYTRSLDAAWEGAKRGDWFIGVEGPFADSNVYLATIHTDCSETGFHEEADHPAEALVLACLRAVGVDESELE
jgi:hypothetical protein